MVRYALMLVVPAMLVAVPPPGACPGGAALGEFELAVRDAGEDAWEPLRSKRRVDGGASVRYTPGELFTGSGEAQVSLISIPTTPQGVLGVLESHRASQAAEWVIPSRVAAVALVFGPAGVDLSKLARLVDRDPQLVPQLAMYAEKSAQTEILWETVTEWERSGSTQSLEAALQGFASRQGVAMPLLNRNAAMDQQALTLMRALHPTLANLDPLSTERARVQQSAGLAASVAGLFFGNAVGMASMSGALFLNLRTLLFPGSEFRSALVQTVGVTEVLCAKREPAKSRTKLVYLWAWRIQAAPPPVLEGLPFRVNLGARAPLVLLKGTNLETIRGASVEGASVTFAPEPPSIAIALGEEARKGARLDLKLEVEDSPTPLTIPGAIAVLGPRPAIRRARAAAPSGLPVPLLEGELAANAFTAVSVSAVDAGALPSVHVECLDRAVTLRKLSLRPGEQSGAARLRSSGAAGEFVLSFEPGAVGHPPCTLAATVETEDGVSDAAVLGNLVRLPRIDKFALTEEAISRDVYLGYIEGEELESIRAAGWNEDRGLPVTGPPIPLGNGARQRLRVTMSWPPPSPRAPVYVWLGGEAKGRRSTAVY